MDLIVFGLSRCVLLDPISDDMRAWTGTGISVINIEKKRIRYYIYTQPKQTLTVLSTHS